MEKIKCVEDLGKFQVDISGIFECFTASAYIKHYFPEVDVSDQLGNVIDSGANFVAINTMGYICNCYKNDKKEVISINDLTKLLIDYYNWSNTE